jgi:magnesium transporter
MDENAIPQRPDPTALQTPPQRVIESNATLRPDAAAGPQTIPKKKRNNHRGGKKKRTRRQSFAASNDDGAGMPGTSRSHRREDSENAARASFYRVQGRNLSNTSVESNTLLDHR